MIDLQVAVSHHCPATIPTTTPNNVDSAGSQRIRSAHDGTDIEVMTEVLDCNLERERVGCDVFADRVHRPVAILVFNVTMIAVLQ